MALRFLTPIKSCKRCEHFFKAEYYEGECEIHNNASTDEWGEPYEDGSSTYPHVSAVWLKFGEDHAAKYCGEYFPVRS